jgi:hypothetical protein
MELNICIILLFFRAIRASSSSAMPDTSCSLTWGEDMHASRALCSAQGLIQATQAQGSRPPTTLSFRQTSTFRLFRLVPGAARPTRSRSLTQTSDALSQAPVQVTSTPHDSVTRRGIIAVQLSTVQLNVAAGLGQPLPWQRVPSLSSYEEACIVCCICHLGMSRGADRRVYTEYGTYLAGLHLNAFWSG